MFAASQGLGPPVSVVVPSGLDRPPPPSVGKVVVGDRLSNSLDTDNFTIQWSDPETHYVAATLAADALEEAWISLVEDQQWGAPTSGDWAKIWVILDPSLAGTGLTTGLPTDAHPEGVPIIYLNPIYVDQPDFFRSLAVHEFGHALQFRVRTWYGAEDTEPWFWEATSEWMTEIVAPEWDQYAWSSGWYAAAPEQRFDSMEGYHQYGMMLLNAYIDEYRGGPQTVWDIWLENEGRSWLEEIESTLGEDAIETWPDFVGAYAAEQLQDSALYEAPVSADLSGEIPGELGSVYVNLGVIDGAVRLSAGIGTMVRDGSWFVFESWADIPPGTGTVTVVVTNPDVEPLMYTVTTVGPDEEEDSPASFDTGGEHELFELQEGGNPHPKGCGCASRTGGGAAWAWLLGLVAWLRRRATGRFLSPRECPRQ
jgi:uncharacterized protein (TIGR03382 family)